MPSTDGITYIATRNIPLDELTPFPGNAKRGVVPEILKSLRRNGQYRGLVVREIPNGPLVVLAGNHTMQALALHGPGTCDHHNCALCSNGDWNGAPRCEVIQCDDHTARRINIADNRTAELGTYDQDALVELLSYLDGDYEGTGYTEDDIEALITPPAIEELDPAEPDDTPAAPPADPVTKPGDVWILGPHRILCGDSRDYEDVTRLLDGQRINIAFTSPPYASQRTYDETSGFKPIPPDEYTDWFADVQANVRAHLADDGSWFVNIKEHTDDGCRDLYVKDLTIAHVRQWGWCYIDELVWHKDGLPGGYTNRFKNAWEPVFHFALRTDVKFRPDAVAVESNGSFEYDPTGNITMNSSEGRVGQPVNRGEGLARPCNVVRVSQRKTENGVGHSAVFPPALPEWFIKAYSDQGDAVYDPFMGSGSTLLAAHRNERVAYGTEISPGYCDVICRRFQQATGITPVLEATGEQHDFTAEPANQ